MSILSLFFLISLVKIANSLGFCQESCSRTSNEIIRFPFGLTGGRCSYPGFNLSCTPSDQTILSLPHSGNFIVKYIDYKHQDIYVTDPGNCMARRFLDNFTLSGSPFVADFYRSFTFLNCSSNVSIYNFPPPSRIVSCLSNRNFTIVAVQNSFNPENRTPSIPSCTVMNNDVHVPVSWHRNSEGMSAFRWTRPNCINCERKGGTCGFKDNSSLDISCYNLPKKALPRSAKYGIIIGIGIPGLLCIIGLSCYLCGKIRELRHGRNRSRELPTTFQHQQPSMAMQGLDGPTLELYPKTLLGASRRLPKPNDNTCPICLCEYEAKETLRTIPECNHYFHADCIDEWLKMNATCPLCRNSPDVSSMATSSSSSSLSAASIANTPTSDSSSSLYSGP